LVLPPEGNGHSSSGVWLDGQSVHVFRVLPETLRPDRHQPRPGLQ
jgi:hypothetical protein